MRCSRVLSFWNRQPFIFLMLRVTPAYMWVFITGTEMTRSTSKGRLDIFSRGTMMGSGISCSRMPLSSRFRHSTPSSWQTSQIPAACRASSLLTPTMELSPT